MQRITKILTVVGIFIMVMVTNYHDVSANYKADYYLRTGSRNLLLAKSFHVDFNVDITGKDYNFSTVINSDVENVKQMVKTDFFINGYFKEKNFSEQFQQYADLSGSKDNLYTYDGKQWTRMSSPKQTPAKLTVEQINYIDYKVNTVFAGVITNEIITENSEYALIDIKVNIEKAKQAFIKEFYPKITATELQEINTVLRNVGGLDIIVKYNKRNMMLEEHKLDLSRPVATVAINMLDLWGGNNKNKDLYKGFFQNFNFVIGASYNRFNQIDDIVVPLEAKVGKLIKADDVLKAGEELSKVAKIN